MYRPNLATRLGINPRTVDLSSRIDRGTKESGGRVVHRFITLHLLCDLYHKSCIYGEGRGIVYDHMLPFTLHIDNIPGQEDGGLHYCETFLHFTACPIPFGLLDETRLKN